MGGFNSGRRGGSVTAEATASYVFSTRLLTRAKLKDGMRGETTLRFNSGDFPVTLRLSTCASSRISRHLPGTAARSGLASPNLLRDPRFR